MQARLRGRSRMDQVISATISGITKNPALCAGTGGAAAITSIRPLSLFATLSADSSLAAMPFAAHFAKRRPVAASCRNPTKLGRSDVEAQS